MAAIHVDKESFDKEVLKSNKPVLVDFWAPWCGPCQMLGPIVEEVAEEKSDVKVCKVNIDEEPDLAVKYQVMSIPTLILFKDGEVANTSVGVIPKTKILNLINEL